MISGFFLFLKDKIFSKTIGGIKNQNLFISL